MSKLDYVDQNHYCEDMKVFTPRELVDHLFSHTDCVFHQITADYLKTVYKHWWNASVVIHETQTSHYALEALDTDEFKTAMKIFQRFGYDSDQMYNVNLTSPKLSYKFIDPTEPMLFDASARNNIKKRVPYVTMIQSTTIKEVEKKQSTVNISTEERCEPMDIDNDE